MQTTSIFSIKKNNCLLKKKQKMPQKTKTPQNHNWKPNSYFTAEFEECFKHLNANLKGDWG